MTARVDVNFFFQEVSSKVKSNILLWRCTNWKRLKFLMASIVIGYNITIINTYCATTSLFFHLSFAGIVVSFFSSHSSSTRPTICHGNLSALLRWLGQIYSFLSTGVFAGTWHVLVKGQMLPVICSLELHISFENMKSS